MRPVRWALIVGLAVAAGAVAVATRWLGGNSGEGVWLRHTVAFSPALARHPLMGVLAGDPLAGVQLPVEGALEPGETLGGVLAGYGLEPREVGEVVALVGDHADLRRLRPSDTYAVYLSEEARLAGFELTVAGKGRVSVRRGEPGWESAWRPFVRTVETRSLSGELVSSLEGAIVEAGGRAVLAPKMAEALQWDVDFHRDLRTGDLFELLYEEVYLDGEFFDVGRLLAMRYENRGRLLEAYLYGEDDGYYDAEGRPLRKMFLRSPLRYSRVTSRFSHRRFHPVLKRYRPHYGVDYGAPTGTPVRVTASGVVAFAGWDGGGGKTVKVRHPNGFLTAYLHLSRYASGIRSGRRVRQGEVIAYTGSTGLSTAPHLDYRIQHRGRWINPETLKSQPAEPIPESRLADYVAWRDALRRALEGEGPFEPPAGELIAASVAAPVPAAGAR